MIPDIDISWVMARVHEQWDPARAPHHVVAGQNGTGKTTIITQAILPLATQERQLVLDIKGDDPALNAYPAAVVDRLRPGFGSDGEGGGPDGLWFRLVLDMADKDERTGAKARAREALEIVLDEGHCTLVIDETRRLTDTRGLNQGDLLESILMSNRSRRTQVIMTLVSVEWAPPSVRNQWAFSWTGPLKDDKVRNRWLELLGLDHGKSAGSYLAEFRRIPRHRWLYRDEEGPDGGLMAVTGLDVPELGAA